MVKQLIVTATLLLLQNIPEINYCTQVIFEFTMLTDYPLYNNETLFYMEHNLCRLDKIKIMFKNYCPISVTLFRPTFNYPKFHAITNFIKYI